MDIQQAIQKVQSLNNQVNANAATITKQTIEMNFAVLNKEKTRCIHHITEVVPYRKLSKGYTLSYRIISSVINCFGGLPTFCFR